MKSNYTDQQSSVLLNKEENDQVFKLLGPKCQTLATTVVQLYATDGPESTHWIKRDVGVLCLVRDANKRSYFFRLYCLVRNRMVWEHEIYNNMQYLAPRSFLHTFEAEERVIAFNFANEDEAASLREILLEKLKFKAQRRLDKKNRENSLNRSQSAKQISTRSTPVQVPVSNTNTIGNGFLPSKSKAAKSVGSIKKSKKKCRPLTKDDISQPVDFVHVSHVGFDKNVGFKMDNIDETMKQFFDKVGISENVLKDKETMEYIYDFIEKHGGYDAVKQNLHQSAPVPASPPPPPPVPARNVPAFPSTNTLTRTAPPPPPPTGIQRVMHPAPPPPPSGPPPSNVLIQRNQNQLRNVTTSKSQSPNNVPPPPPPPPPLPSADPVEKSVLLTSAAPSESVVRNSAPDPRSALMEAIRGGHTLKHVETETKKSGGDDSRGELLSQIRQGVELKSVPQVSKPDNNLANNDLASALARALLKRAELMHTDSSDSDDMDDSDNEWDD